MFIQQLFSKEQKQSQQKQRYQFNFKLIIQLLKIFIHRAIV